MKGEKYFENIHENYVPNVKDHVISTVVTKENGVRVVPNTSLHQNSILKKKRKLLNKHNSGLSTLWERSDNQIKINICTEEEKCSWSIIWSRSLKEKDTDQGKET